MNAHATRIHRHAPHGTARIAAATALVAGLALHALSASAGLIPISDTPLYLGGGVRPNVFFEVDDSGSMEFSIITQAYWEACGYDSNFPGDAGSSDCGTHIDDGAYHAAGNQYEYMFDASDNQYSAYYDNVFGNGPSTSSPIPTVAQNDWRIMSSDFNVLYFDPGSDYQPWWGMSDASFSSARSAPDPAANGYSDTRNLAGFTFSVWDDNRGFDGSRPHRGAVPTDTYTGVSTVVANSGSYSMYVSGGVGEMTTRTLDTSGASATVDLWIQQGSSTYGTGSESPDPGEYLLLEYRNSSGNWVQLDSFEGTGNYTTPEPAISKSYNLPADARHKNFALRIRSSGGSGSGFDYWHIDDLDISSSAGGTLLQDDFESGTFQAKNWAGGLNANDTPNGLVDLWDKHATYTVYSDHVDKTVVTYAPDSSGLNPTSTTTTLTDGSSPSVSDEFGKTLAELQQDIANWFTYNRRRRQVATGSIGATIRDNPSYRYGLSVINKYDSLFVEVPSKSTTDFSTHNSSLFDSLTAFDWPPDGTPLRKALQRTGEYFSGNLSGKTNPIKYECQQNFAVLMSDGYYSGGSSGNPGVGDVDSDGLSNSLADVARKYYANDLDTTMANNVPPTPQDPNTKQHMVTFTVAFGVDGKLSDTDGDGWPNPALDVSDSWTPTLNPNDTTDDPEKIDDMWHAAWNSKGTFVSAKTPDELAKSLQAALGEIGKRDSSAAAVALNSQSYSTDALLYQARFNSDDWSGQLIAYPLVPTFSSDGQRLRLEVSDTPEWDAADLLDAMDPDSRQIITFKPSSDRGIPFEWPSDPANPGTDDLDAGQITALDTKPASGGTNDGKGAARLAFLRGDRSNEGTATGDFRVRSSVLGDIIDSAPVFVGAPSFLYSETWPAPPGQTTADETSYSAFYQAHKDRTPMIYVGSNDGMLHGFNADSGAETLSFVPSAVFPDLNQLTDPDYDHKYFVDGSPVYADAFFNGAWHSVVAGGLRAGGQGVYALDVTDPSAFSEGQAANIALWEFTDHDDDSDGLTEGDSDLGYTFAQPSIVRLHNGDWAAIFGNGYNNTEADGHPSTTGDAVLYIVDIETGAIIRKLDTGYGTADDPTSAGRPNGMSSPAPVDVDGDGVVDYVFAGDIFGNLWKFDLTDGDPTNWASAVTSGSSPAPMFTAESSGGDPQPITVRPQVGRQPAGKDGLMVYFGTGKYIGSGDNVQTGQTTQSFYAVWDRTDKNGNQTVFQRDDLLVQSITDEVTVDPNNTPGDPTDDVDLRLTSNNEISTWYGDGSGSDPGKGGWVMDFVNPTDSQNHGEKAVTDPVLRNGRIIFTTLIPSQSPCDFGGSGWLMELDAQDGSYLSEPPFDLNNDVVFDGSDTSNGTVPGGKKSKVGIVPTPAILLTPDRTEAKFVSGSTGEVESVTENSGNEDRGRQAWEELK